METLYLDDITGCLGQWLDWNTDHIPNDIMERLTEAYELATIEAEKDKGKEQKAKEIMAHIHMLITEANTINDMGDTYIPEKEIINYLKECL